MRKEELLDKIDEMSRDELLKLKSEITEPEISAYIETCLSLKNAADTPDLWPAFRVKLAEKSSTKTGGRMFVRILRPFAVTLAIMAIAVGLWTHTRSESNNIANENDFVLTTYTEIADSEYIQDTNEENAMDYYYAIATK